MKKVESITKEQSSDLYIKYQPDYPLGAYLKRWCNYNGIGMKEFNLGIGYSYNFPIFRVKSVSLERFLSIVDYMSSRSALDASFYMTRLKNVMQGNYIWKR